MRIQSYLLLFISLFSVLPAFSEVTHYTPTTDEQIGPVLNQTYLGVGLGYVAAPVSNSDLAEGFQASSFSPGSAGWNAYLGHYFNPYFAIELDFMRAIESTRQTAYNVNGISNNNYPFFFFMYGVVLRPTLPISSNFSLYLQEGYGLITRNGFAIGNTQVMTNANISTFLTGGGLSYQFSPYWHLDIGAEYTIARSSEQQPSMTYVFAGIHYLFHKRILPQYYNTQYIFHKNYMQLGAFSKNIWNTDFIGATHVNSGFAFAYERDFFHTHKVFEMDVGTNIASYHAANNQVFQAFSVFPDFRFWFLRTEYADFYLKFNIAGPTYITTQYIDGLNLGGEFIFYDGIGFGGLLGKNKNVIIAAMITHYSNGGLFPENPGIQIPLMFSIGYAF